MLLFSSWQAERTFAVTNMNVRHADKPAIGFWFPNVRLSELILWKVTISLRPSLWSGSVVFSVGVDPLPRRAEGRGGAQTRTDW